MLNRVKQFVMDLYYSTKSIDLVYINGYLDKQELKEFNKLRKSDKQHSIRVAKDSLNILKSEAYANENNIDEKELIRIALLHDIGKNKYRLNSIEKSIMVILNSITKSRVKKYSNKSNIIKSYYYHPQIGVEILKNLNKAYSNEFLTAIECHHKIDYEFNDIQKILKVADDKN